MAIVTIIIIYWFGIFLYFENFASGFFITGINWVHGTYWVFILDIIFYGFMITHVLKVLQTDFVY